MLYDMTMEGAHEVERRVKNLVRFALENLTEMKREEKIDTSIAYTVLDPKGEIRLSVMDKPTHFALTIHYFNGEKRGLTIAKVIEHNIDENKNQYLNETWIYPEYNIIYRLFRGF